MNKYERQFLDTIKADLKRSGRSTRATSFTYINLKRKYAKIAKETNKNIFNIVRSAYFKRGANLIENINKGNIDINTAYNLAKIDNFMNKFIFSHFDIIDGAETEESKKYKNVYESYINYVQNPDDTTKETLNDDIKAFKTTTEYRNMGYGN